MRKLLVVCLLASLSAACSTRTGATPSTSATSSGSQSVAPTASPSKKLAHVVSARFALYTFSGSIWLYDVRTNKTRQVTQGGTVSSPKWIDADHFSFVDSGNTLKIADIKAATTSDLFTAQGGIQAYGWSPDGQTVAYIETDANSYPHLRYRSIADGSTQSVATLARAPGRGVTQADDLRIQYSKDGRYVLVVYTPADGDSGSVPPDQSQFQVRGGDGSLAFSVDMSREPTMGIFSRDGKNVYYMDSSGVRAWSVTGSVRTLRKMQWFNPSQSPDGTKVAFDSGDSSTKVRVKVLDLRASTVTAVSKPGRALPVFVGPHSLWAQEVSACPGVCDGPTFGGVFLIDTVTKAEKLLPIQSLQDADVFYS